MKYQYKVSPPHSERGAGTPLKNILILILLTIFNSKNTLSSYCNNRIYNKVKSTILTTSENTENEREKGKEDKKKRGRKREKKKEDGNEKEK